ncbi:MAG: phosphate acyltransferase PlsX [Hyphomonadaceae bacterium]|nr:phosphate acyltransferase PlsX [Clostridia bacterium]
MKIAVDAMGGDHAPEIVIEAAVNAVNQLDVEIILVGNQEKITQKLATYTYPKDKLHIVHTAVEILNEDKPSDVVRSKKDASMFMGLAMVKQKQADAFVSAGNTGALLMGALLFVGRIKGVDRPTLAPLMPNDKQGSLLTDAGANVQCRPQHLVQFGEMGTIYMQKVMGIQSPSVGLINIGAEQEKGTDLTKEAYQLMQKAKFRFVGNVEARDIPKGDVDVLVCDGFVGNVLLKFLEGLGMTFYQNVKNIFKSSKVGMFAALLLKKQLTAFKKKLDYSEQGGAPFLGIDGVVIKAHGSSDAKAFYHAIRQAKVFAQTGVNEEIKIRFS